MTICAVILAAGKGTRMNSDLAKVLHPLAGRPLLSFPLRAAVEAGAGRIVVVTGHAEADVRRAAEATPHGDATLAFAHQAQQHGTGHAVLCALPEVPTTGTVLVLSGDVPLLRAQTLEALVTRCEQSTAKIAFATFEPDDLTGYGRVQRDEAGRVVRIVEDRDCDPHQKTITECNAGTYGVGADRLHATVPGLGRDNAQGEMYLTDLVEILARDGEVATVPIDPREAAGVNTLAQLKALQAELGNERPR